MATMELAAKDAEADLVPAEPLRDCRITKRVRERCDDGWLVL